MMFHVDIETVTMLLLALIGDPLHGTMRGTRLATQRKTYGNSTAMGAMINPQK
jgi:hypothetical protein